MRGVFCGWWTLNHLRLRNSGGWSPTPQGGSGVCLGQDFSGLAAGDRCEPGECTSHRNRHSGRRFLSRPTGEDKREGREWEKGSFITQRMESVEMSVEIPLQWIRQKHSTAIQTALKKKSDFPRHKKLQATHSYLRSVDFDGNVVALRRPLGGFGHFEPGADQVNTELALTGDNMHQFVHKRCLIHGCTKGKSNSCVSPTCGHLAAL